MFAQVVVISRCCFDTGLHRIVIQCVLHAYISSLDREMTKVELPWGLLFFSKFLTVILMFQQLVLFMSIPRLLYT